MIFLWRNIEISSVEFLHLCKVDTRWGWVLLHDAKTKNFFSCSFTSYFARTKFRKKYVDSNTGTSCNFCLHLNPNIIYWISCVHLIFKWTITSFLPVQIAFSSGDYQFLERNYRSKLNGTILNFKIRFKKDMPHTCVWVLKTAKVKCTLSIVFQMYFVKCSFPIM